MQFVTNGPDVPDQLLQLHEEGQVVFFCGAGISYPAGLPGFKGLVDRIYEGLGTKQTALEKDAYERKQFDATLDLLERRIPGQRLALRRKLADALKPRWRLKGATDTHASLLDLARCQDGSLRLVTTNFDVIFERAARKAKKDLRSYVAPMLPLPKNSRWDGLVYLHGLLPKKPDDDALNRLVVTSGDFGLGYLTERWAARFVSELFRQYVVCFVGYTINDPVLRYMMDALAADRMLGEATPQAYAFGECGPGQEETATVEWKAKGVTPILYELPSNTNDHSALHRTLRAWADTYRDGTLGKERIVLEHALARPSASTRQDDFVGRMLWALSHDSGLPAKQFAELNPVPPLDWLEALTDARFKHWDLSRFGVTPRSELDSKLNFSLANRPTPYPLAPRMSLVTYGPVEGDWDYVMFQIARWLARHLNDPALVLWLAQHGGHLHSRLIWRLDQALREIDRLAGDQAALDEIRSNAPNAVPDALMRVLWRILLAGLVKSPEKDLDLYRWKERFKSEGLTATLRIQLRELLSPKVALSKPFRWTADGEATTRRARVKDLVDFEIVLTAEAARSALRDLAGAQWQAALPELLDDLQGLLRDALDLLRELGEADEEHDRSFWDIPSISPHRQNRGYRDWVTLIELVRDAWLSVRDRNPGRATNVASSWFGQPYPTFKRLALFAAAHDDRIPQSEWIGWLTSSDAWWLWSLETRRETLRLLVMRGAASDESEQAQLEGAILKGPPRRMYREDLPEEDWDDVIARCTWLSLAKLRSSGARLSADALQRLNAISGEHPLWRIDEDERDEFSHWSSGTGDPDFKLSTKTDVAPRTRRELVRWLQQPSRGDDPWHRDTWRETAKARLFHSLLALGDLAREGVWPTDRWREALKRGVRRA